MGINYRYILLILILCFELTHKVVAENEWKQPLIPVSASYTLKNGLKVVLSEDHSTPVVAVVVIYDVGSRNEEKGRSGFAHLFEHMMFQGSENVGKSEHFKYVESAGGSMNGSTHSDFTNYFETMPSNQVELALWLESDRMRSLKVTQENFQNQLETVKEEKRFRVDNQPYVPASIKLEEMLYDNWANGHSAIGSFEDLEASSIHDVSKFFKTYYAPNNAVIAVVGDFNTSEMKPLIEKYFASIPSQTAPSQPNVSEPEQKKAKYAKVDDLHAQVPGFWIGWKAPAKRDPDYFASLIIEKILAAGDSSRFYQAMVKGKQVALKADLGLDERRGPGAFEGFILYKPNYSADQVRSIMWSELDQLKKQPVSQFELEKARNIILKNYFASGHQSLQRALGKAETIAEYTLFFGDPSLVDKDLEALMNVTPEDIQRVANKIFTKEGTTVVDVVPSHSSNKPKA
jgi:predicted Zn-dependent peptidase